MANPKYGSIDIAAKIESNKLKGRRSQLVAPPIDITADKLEQRLHELAYQNRAPSVAKAAAAELLDRKSPKSKNPEAMLTANEARRIDDIYHRIFAPGE